MKTFDEFKDYLSVQIKHLLINDDNDLLNLTKLLLNYGKIALRYYPNEVEKLIKDLEIYGLKEDELNSKFFNVLFKGNMVQINTADKKTYTFPIKSFVESISDHPGDARDLMIALSISLVNKKQELFQIVAYSELSKKRK